MSFLLGRRVLVTGATGMLGRALCLRLEKEGATVLPLTRRVSAIGEGIDLSDRVRLRDYLQTLSFDAVVHLAVAGVSPGDTRSVFLTNTIGTESLLECLSSLPVCPVVLAGSWTEYGPSIKPSGLMSESDPCTPSSAYGISKLAATLLGLAWAKKENRPLTVLRFFNLYGPGEGAHRLGPTVVRALQEGKAPVLSSPSMVRDFVFLDDAVEACVRALSLKETGCLLNIGTGEGTSLISFVQEIQRAMGATLDPVWKMDQPRPWDVPAAIADLTYTQSLLGWTPRIALPQGIPLAIKAFQSSV